MARKGAGKTANYRSAMLSQCRQGRCIISTRRIRRLPNVGNLGNMSLRQWDAVMNSSEAMFVGEAVVGPGGRLEIDTPLPAQAHVRVLVQFADDSDDLVSAATSSLSFWDNPLDDEDWNEAGSR